MPIVNDGILSEYSEVLGRPKFGFIRSEVDSFLDDMAHRARWLEARSFPIRMIDEKDRIFIETVLVARQDFEAYLVTGNAKHFPTEPFVVPPAIMLAVMGNIDIHYSQ